MTCSRRSVFLLALSFTGFSPAPVYSACVNTTVPGLFFRCELTLQDFNLASGAISIIAHRVHQTGYAGVPGWVNSVATADSLILYGTPTEGDLGSAHLVVTLQDNVHQIGIRTLELTVEPLQGQIAQYSELYVTSHNVEDLLIVESYEEMTTTLMEVYSPIGGLEPLIIALIDPRERNILVPEPPAKIGVIMRITPGLNVSVELSTATPQAALLVQGSCIGSVMSPPSNFDTFSLRGFTIDWCRYTVRYTDTTIGTVTPQTTPPPSGVAEPTADGSSLTLIVIVVVVGVVILSFLCVLSCIFFCGRRFSIIVPNSQRAKNAVILKDTNSSVLEMSKAQVILRSFSTLPPSPDEGGMVTLLELRRPESGDTVYLEYQDVLDNSPRDVRLDHSPPMYRLPEILHQCTDHQRSSTNVPTTRDPRH